MTETKSQNYELLRLYYRSGGSYQYYIDRMVAEARAAGAPADAVYRRENGSWVTAEQLYADNVRTTLGLEPLRITPANVADVVAWGGGEVTGAGMSNLFATFSALSRALDFVGYVRPKVTFVDLAKPVRKLDDPVTLQLILMPEAVRTPPVGTVRRGSRD